MPTLHSNHRSSVTRMTVETRAVERPFKLLQITCVPLEPTSANVRPSPWPRDYSTLANLNVLRLVALLYDISDATYLERALAASTSTAMRDFRVGSEGNTVAAAFPVGGRIFRDLDVDGRLPPLLDPWLAGSACRYQFRPIFWAR